MKKQGLLQHTIIMETGDRKEGIREMIREELHEQLVQVSAFQFLNLICDRITLNILFDNVRMPDLGCTHNPLFVIPNALTYDGKTGGINVIDLANINSCSFINYGIW
jgi:hypothetical protein